MSKYLKVIIKETACGTPKQINESSIFNEIREEFKTIEEVEKFLFDRYGKTISKAHRTKKGIFIDKNDDKECERIGFTYSFWNKDYSHNTKKWYQTDWITVKEVTEEFVVI